jgi:uncharacterized protein (TIGR00255 family)
MLMSMTGYGHARAETESFDISIEIKSVNHKYFECTVRTPRAYGFLEERLKTLAKEKISRGKTEINLSLFAKSGEEKITINRAVVEECVNALLELPNEWFSGGLSRADILRMPDALSIEKITPDEEKFWEDVRKAAVTALDEFLAMRKAEGARLAADVSDKLDAISANVGKIEKLSPERVNAYREKLSKRIAEIIGDRNIDEGRILTEAAIFAEKTAVDEEIVRLKSHIEAYRKYLTATEPIGRKADFLTQEMNRETNTIGSKCQDLEITGIVLEMKSDIEKIREQIQNIE